MCGIAGIFNKNKNQIVEEKLLKNITDTLHHRGPDDEGYYFDKNLGFGHKRLSIIDLESGKQPISNEDKSVWIVFNGEIYNYIELRGELISLGHKFTTHTDTEVIVHLYEEYGAKLLSMLNGMFAFVIWDSKKNKILAARDHFGIKPFYYYHDNETFVFASEIKALLKHFKIKAKSEYNSDAIKEYIVMQLCLGDHTLFQNIQKLLPGNYLELSTTNWKPKTKEYWTLDFTVDTHHTEDYYTDKLLLLLEDSIRLQLRSDVPVGAHLSGGLDSSLVVSLASNLLGKPLKTFSGGFKDSKDYDETEYAKIVAAASGANYFDVFPSPYDFIDSFSKIVYHMDEPVAGPGVFPQYFVSKLAAQNVKVVLGGQGGDEIFGGYARYLVAYLEQCLKGAIFETQEEGKYVVTIDSIIPNLNLLQNYKPMLQQFFKTGLFEPMDRRYFKLINRAGDSVIYNSDFINKNDIENIFEKYQKLFNEPTTLSYFNKMTHFDMKTLLPGLLQVEDRTSMAFSLESRVPLLDYRIVELIASIPPTLKFKGGKTKHIFKRAIQNVIPKQILERKDKKGFPVPLTEWYKGPLKEFVYDHLLDKKIKERGIYNPDNIKILLDNEAKFGRQIWGLLNLEMWHRTFIDN